ncbi:MAG: LysM peptidoglycan-binding domain-containing protein [Prevotellaceae bacterium]|jgi:LysM repeat protein|nr:LysM peptidoglycan-binding domain-containing protein [Prevotellaceae bacterium]
MKRKTLRYLLPFVLLLFVFSAFAQVEIKKSTEKVRIGDKIFYIHLVKQGETIYSLCRVYNVSNDELVSANPQLSKGLKAGQRLKIPEKTELKQETAKPVENTNNGNKKNVNGTKNIISDTTSSAIKYKIKSGDNLESIAKKHNCTVEDILKYNSFLNQKPKLKKGQYLTIYPNKNELSQQEKTTGNDSIVAVTADSVDVDCNKNLYSGDVLNVILMLPIKASEINNKLQKNQRNAYDFIEFYEGFLLAIDSLNRNNISVNLTVLDVYDTHTLNAALISPAFDKAQLIIEHLPKNLADAFAKIAVERKIPVVSSFSHETENISEKGKYFIQAFTPLSYQNKKLNQALCSANENVIVIYEEITDTVSFDNFVQILKNCGKTVKTYHYRLHGSQNEALQNELYNDAKNNIVVLSNNKVFVMDVMSKLNAISLKSKYDVTVYGLSHWKVFEESLNFDHIHNLNLTIPQLFFVDYNRDEVKSFISKYRYYYKGDPSRFSFHGYDLGIYFIDKLAKYGQNFMQCITNDEASTLLQTRFKFDRILPQGGLVNTELLLVRHTKDLNIVVE